MGMKWFLLITMVLNMVNTAVALTAEARYTHGVFYRGVTHQPVLQLKLTGSPGEKISAISFSSGATSSTANIKAVRFGTTRGWNGFTINTNKLIEQLASGKFSKGKIRFETKLELGDTPLYLWLYYDIAPKANRKAKIDGICTGIETDSGTVVPQIILAEGIEERVIPHVYPFPYRVVPYYRPRWVKGWGNAEKAVHLTPAHFHLFTELVHFAYSVNAEGGIEYQWVGGGDNKTVADEALAEIKRLHTEAQARSGLIAGFGHMDGPMTTAMANPHTRRTLAYNMAQWAISRGYSGIDIDWEYPDSWEQWQQLGYFIADLREELSGSGLSVSIASSVGYKKPNYWTTDQLDFIMTMSYDDLAQDNHASMRLFHRDANMCLNEFHMPKSKIVLGLPFYSNQKGALKDQYGYSQILGWHPRIKPNVNEFVAKNKDGSNGPVHTFNSPELIAEKCRWVKQEQYGGVMIWAYETDVPLKHRASLGRAMYKVIRQPKNKEK